MLHNWKANFNYFPFFRSGVDGSNLAQFFELNNGCICCSVKGDLLATLEQLAMHKSKFDYILIETTGRLNH